jgi:hypothetical protein
MRKHAQKQILELIVTVWDGIAYAVSPNTSQESAVTVLQDCRAALDAIDHSLKSGLSEERYSLYNQIIKVILKMKDTLFKSLINGHVDNVFLGNLDNQFNHIYSELLAEPEVKLEIVFLPYKSSMWDSLESIWRATKEDSSCDCYVIPIPYYDRNADSSIGEFFYEGEDFPDYVPITNFNNYDISERKPDIVYIHNPFDQYNRVTTVHPNYFSAELKKYVETLIYVPYFVMGGGTSESDIYMLPVYQHMDSMIVQSEHYKQFYKEFIPENKLVALGSPKVDRMLYFEKNKPSIPKAWEHLVKNKKIVMYNTSISGILQHGIKVIKKMEYVFSQFSGKEDVVLLWRPHPLIEATLKSMNPLLLEAYLNLKEQFILNNMGIYDTTTDINASIAISDAYIGEETSSIVHLFGVAGKPIFLTKMEYDKAPTEDDIFSLSFHDCYLEDDTIWFVANSYNTLCKMNLVSGETEFVGKIPSVPAKDGQFCDIIKAEDKVTMLPMASPDICEYDLQKNKFEKIALHNPVAHNFDRMLRYKDSLFMKPKGYPAILQYDIKSGVQKYHNKWLEEFRKDDNSEMFMWGVHARDNLLLLASSVVNKVLEFDMETGNSKVHVVGAKGMNFNGMEFDGVNYWLIPNEGKAIVKWNYTTGETTEYTDYPEGFIGETRGFIGIVCCGSHLLAFPREANMIIRIDIATGKMSEFILNLPYKEGERKSSYHSFNSQYYFVKKVEDNQVIALTAYDNSLLIYNVETEELKLMKCRLNKKDIEGSFTLGEDFYNLGDNLPYVARESQYLSLNRFVNDYVISELGHDRDIQKQAYSSVINNMDGTCGDKVHQYVKEQLF